MAISAKGRLIGGKKAIQRLQKMANRSVGALAAALYAEGLHVMTRSVPITPVMTGYLRNSHFVTIPTFRGMGVKLKVGYGAKYAYRRHEGIVTRLRDMPRNQQIAALIALRESGGAKSSQGGDKFLENALDQSEGGRKARIRRSFERNLRRGVTVPVIGNMPGSAAQGRANARKYRKRGRR